MEISYVALAVELSPVSGEIHEQVRLISNLEEVEKGINIVMHQGKDIFGVSPSLFLDGNRTPYIPTPT